MDQAELVAAARDGDRQAFEELVRRTYVHTFTLACRLTGNQEDARDVVQEAYLRAWRGLGRFRGDAQFSTWMYRITANSASTQLKRRRRHRTEPLEGLREPVDERAEGQPASVAESADAVGRLGAAIDELAPKLRAVVVLKDVYGLPHEAIAEELDITVSAAKVRLHRARRQLRDALYEEGAAANAV